MPIVKEEVFFDDGSHTVLFDKTVPVPTLDCLIFRRNDLVRISGDSDEMWQHLGVANRHIKRVVEGTLTLEQVRAEIVDCLDRAEEWFKQSCAS